MSGNTWHLIKAASLLRLTYQIRLLTFMAAERDARLVIGCPRLLASPLTCGPSLRRTPGS